MHTLSRASTSNGTLTNGQWAVFAVVLVMLAAAWFTYQHFRNRR